MYGNFIKSVLGGAAKIANENFGKVSGSVKTGDNNQVLTEADLKIGRFIIQQIEKEFPKDNIIDEEAGVKDKNSDKTWVIDPIDGTSNFAAGVPTYGIIIGLLLSDKPIAGGIVLPFFGEMLVGEKEKGSYLNNKRIEVSKESNLLACLVGYSIDGHQEDPQRTIKECKMLANIVLAIRNLRAAGSVYDGVQVAKGKYGGYLNMTSKIWDNVGQQVIIEEAGGIYTDFFGKKIDYSDPLKKADKNFTWCMGTPQVHRQLQEIISKNLV